MKQSIAEKILSDAQSDAQTLIAQAEEKAQQILADAQKTADDEMEALRKEVEAKCADIAERKAALSRLDGSKITLWQKHRVLDEIYALAERKLLSLPQQEAVAFISDLLVAYAEEGDGVYLAEGFAYEKEVASLPVVKERSLRLSSVKQDFGGGVFLKGEKADKDLSVRALLENDKNENAATLAAKLFK